MRGMRTSRVFQEISLVSDMVHAKQAYVDDISLTCRPAYHGLTAQHVHEARCACGQIHITSECNDQFGETAVLAST